MSAITLALSGGAARGAYHLGVLQYCDENNFCIKALCGTSIGAIIAASYASGVKPKEQLEIFKSKEFKDIFSFNFFNKSLYKIDKSALILDRLLPETYLEDLKIPTYITAVDLISGKNIYFSEGNISELCLASSALIPIFAPVEYGEKRLIDGGVIDHMPLESLKQYMHPIVGVNLHPIQTNHFKNSFFQNTKRALFLNVYGKIDNSKRFCDVYITSQSLTKYSLFSFKYLDELFALGYSDAKELLKIN